MTIKYEEKLSSDVARIQTWNDEKTESDVEQMLIQMLIRRKEKRQLTRRYQLRREETAEEKADIRCCSDVKTNRR
ncbi:hypothetical protein F511_44605 [Dorcoceras hygrometricum]|uniref:Uncharacterized protein n=1 Tax=Dorcoceras hygrometricum TaxID=472368 RepID=A0A2Z7CSM3_9LAMI|nr:hypothetical protein F511_44605 [Dorcoceras hygrometricum]